MEDLTLAELFATADEVGNKYQSDEERQDFEAQLTKVHTDVLIQIAKKMIALEAEKARHPLGSAEDAAMYEKIMYRWRGWDHEARGKILRKMTELSQPL